ncbi:MAG TPA: HAMP domain-containing sensor histidine kinase [Polyangia bacterium]|nr:HAMP domain-containing sensor histidine kinase [Polyangia bacterium]
MKGAAEPKGVPSTWPVFATLVIVAILLLAMLGTDLLVARRVSARTAEIVGNALRSIELVDDLRAQTHRLVDAGLPPDENTATRRRIAADSTAYDHLTTSPGEHEEWVRLRARLHDLEDEQLPAARAAEVAADIESSIDRLVRINGRSADESVEAIHRIHDDAILADIVVGGVALALAALVAALLLRVLARQRQLVATHVALVEGRNRDLDAFAGRAAHDLRVPLSPIRGYADLVALDAEAPPRVREMASRIQIAVARMSRVIDDMLELARAGRVAPGSIAPAAAVARVLEDLRAELADADVVTEIGPDPIACGPGALEQIVRNLLENAAKFRSRARPLVIRIRTERVEDRVRLHVEDNGVGMDPETARHIFEPHYRAQNAREIPGHGLGLAIVESTVRALGGKCEIFASPDAGTAVVVDLPRAEVLERPHIDRLSRDR